MRDPEEEAGGKRGWEEHGGAEIVNPNRQDLLAMQAF